MSISIRHTCREWKRRYHILANLAFQSYDCERTWCKFFQKRVVWWVHWMNDCCLIPIQQISAISWREQVNFQWDDDEVCFVLDQHVEMNLYSASSLKQQSADRHVAPLGHIILIPSQPGVALSPQWCLAEKQQIPIL
jgi:hypothetical protein